SGACGAIEFSVCACWSRTACAVESLSPKRARSTSITGPAGPYVISGVPALGEQAARNHMRLNFGCALEDVEDARVAQHAADLVFQRIAVAAVDLQRRVGIAPGDAGGEQLGHAGLDAAAATLILLPRGEIGQLA